MPVLDNRMVETLETGQLAILIFDKNSIAVPANERACWLRQELGDSSNLEVQVVYAPPEIESILSHSLLASLRIDRVLCSEKYSEELAEKLGAQHDSSPTALWAAHDASPDLSDRVASRVKTPFQTELTFSPQASPDEKIETERVIKAADLRLCPLILTTFSNMTGSEYGSPQVSRPVAGAHAMGRAGIPIASHRGASPSCSGISRLRCR